jgi:hypothetical protein
LAPAAYRGLFAAFGRGFLLHAFGDECHLQADADGGVNDRHHFAVAEAGVGVHEDRLVGAGLEDAAEPRGEVVERDELRIDREPVIGGVFGDDLSGVLDGGGAGLERKVDVRALL